MTKCPRCGELIPVDRERCLGCGRSVPDPSRRQEQRLRVLVIAAFVLPALLLIARMVRDSLMRR